MWELVSPPLITSRMAYKQKNMPTAHFSIKSQNQEGEAPGEGLYQLLSHIRWAKRCNKCQNNTLKHAAMKQRQTGRKAASTVHPITWYKSPEQKSSQDWKSRWVSPTGVPPSPKCECFSWHVSLGFHQLRNISVPSVKIYPNPSLKHKSSYYNETASLLLKS